MKQLFQKSHGYVTLTAVLILGAISLVITVAMTLSGIDYSKTTFATQQSSQAEGLANSCVEEGMAKLWGNASFTGSGSVSLGAAGSCTYTVATGFPVKATNLSMLLKLDEAAASTTFTDATSNANNATCTGTSCPTAGVAGKFSTNAITFDGADDSITVAHSASINLSSVGSYTAWIQPTLGTNQVIWDKSQTGNSNYCMVSANHLSVANGFHCVIGNTTYSSFPGVVVDGQWNHVVFTWSGLSYAMYANGRFVQGGALTTPVTANTNALVIGKNVLTGTQFFTGSLDSVGFWSGALDSNEVRNLYEFGPLKTTGFVVQGTATAGQSTKMAEALVSATLPTLSKSAQHIIIY